MTKVVELAQTFWSDHDGVEVVVDLLGSIVVVQCDSIDPILLQMPPSDDAFEKLESALHVLTGGILEEHYRQRINLAEARAQALEAQLVAATHRLKVYREVIRDVGDWHSDLYRNGGGYHTALHDILLRVRKGEGDQDV